MKRNLLLMVMIITLLLTACSNSEAELTSADDTSVVLEQEAEPTATSTAADSEKDTDTGEEIVRPEGWGEATHDKSADPNYDVVFPQEEVNRIDIVIDPADWQAMLDDMTALYGEAGTRARGMGDGRMRPGGDALPEQGVLAEKYIRSRVTVSFPVLR